MEHTVTLDQSVSTLITHTYKTREWTYDPSTHGIASDGYTRTCTSISDAAKWAMAVTAGRTDIIGMSAVNGNAWWGVTSASKPAANGTAAPRVVRTGAAQVRTADTAHVAMPHALRGAVVDAIIDAYESPDASRATIIDAVIEALGRTTWAVSDGRAAYLADGVAARERAVRGYADAVINAGSVGAAMRAMRAVPADMVDAVQALVDVA